MKTTIKNFAKILLVAITIFSMSTLNSCSKPEDGKNGVDGANGQTGTANVIYSPWVNQGSWYEDVPTFKQMKIIEPKLTRQFYENGLVLGFFRINIGVHDMLPYQFSNVKRDFTPVAFIDGGEVRFSIQSTNGSAIPATELNVNPTFNPQFRYIMIPGGVPSARGISKPDYKKMSYKEICKHFNIPE
jgi:hypothetical protein